jgi:hypothetical protein
VANVEKHPKPAIQEIEQADFSEVPTCGRSPHLIGQYIKNRQSGARIRPAQTDDRAQAITLRFDVPATPGNRERMQERVRALNRLLLESNTPFRLRLV